MADGGTAIDPEAVARLLTPTRHDSRPERLGPSARDVLAPMAEGLGITAVAERLVVTEGAGHQHIRSVFDVRRKARSTCGYSRLYPRWVGGFIVGRGASSYVGGVTANGSDTTDSQGARDP